MTAGVHRGPAPDPAGCYARFCAGVARRQLTSWLADREPGDVVLDLTPGAPSAALCGRTVSLQLSHSDARTDACARVTGDDKLLACLRPQSVSRVVAEHGALAGWVVTEETLRHACRVLRPGGRLLLCVQSLRRGLAELAAAARWAELADAPQADVVLLPSDDGSLRRCFTPEELYGALRDASFEVDWIRPRTVLPPEAVERAVLTDPGALTTMIETELRLAEEWSSGEIAGSWLLASATRPR